MDHLTTVPPSDFASLYLQDHECKKSRARTRSWTIPALRRCGVHAGAILCVGCANGMDVLELRDRGYEATGIDLYPPRPEAEAWFIRGSVTAVPMPSDSFDGATCLEVIEHVPVADRPRAASELLRVLRPGGVLLLATPNRYFPADEHGNGRVVRLHSPFRDETLTCGELEALFGRRAETLPWSGYFQFERFGALSGVIDKVSALFNGRTMHRSPFNPHLFLAFRK